MAMAVRMAAYVAKRRGGGKAAKKAGICVQAVALRCNTG
jgi:hypothetical protein